MSHLSSEEMILLNDLLTEHEGLRLYPYLDCCGKPWKKCQCDDAKKGKLTIGVGRNLDDVGISKEEAVYLLKNNISNIIIEVEKKFGSWFNNLNSTRKIVVLSMVFNLGLVGFTTFDKMIKYIKSGDYKNAANQMLLSKWASQVGKRATDLSRMMRDGVILTKEG